MARDGIFGNFGLQLDRREELSELLLVDLHHQRRCSATYSFVGPYILGLTARIRASMATRGP